MKVLSYVHTQIYMAMPTAEVREEKLNFEVYVVSADKSNEKALFEFLKKLLFIGQERGKNIVAEFGLGVAEDEDFVVYIIEEIERKIFVEGEERSYFEKHTVATLSATKIPPWRLTVWIPKEEEKEIEEALKETVNLVLEVAREILNISSTPILKSSS